MTSPTRAVALLRRLTDAQPFEVFIAFLCTLSGLPLLFNGPGPGTIEETLPAFLVSLWGVELVAGGVLTLIGLAVDSVALERLGLSLLSAASAVYGIVLLVAAWPASIVSAAITLGFAAACFARIRSMRRTAVVVQVEGHDEPDVRS